MKPITIRRTRKYEAEQAIDDLVARGFEVVFPLTEFSRDGKIFDRDAYNRQVFVEHTHSSCWIAQMRKVMDMRINELCKQAYETAKSKGWHDEERETGTLLALIHSEVSEALEADRKGWDGDFAEELADVCIRVFDLCGSKGIDLEYHIKKKMEYNKTRTHKHGGKAY
ncbi:hypothetical protein ABE096_14115 [Robertmurraya massiliosenegalensis]|uniref:hypothetical protein n=1 Tax=Robertmurraya TaxID=2837507 RepID=UPI0039A507A4